MIFTTFPYFNPKNDKKMHFFTFFTIFLSYNIQVQEDTILIFGYYVQKELQNA